MSAGGSVLKPVNRHSPSWLRYTRSEIRCSSAPTAKTVVQTSSRGRPAPRTRLERQREHDHRDGRHRADGVPDRDVPRDVVLVLEEADVVGRRDPWRTRSRCPGSRGRSAGSRSLVEDEEHGLQGEPAGEHHDAAADECCAPPGVHTPGQRSPPGTPPRALPVRHRTARDIDGSDRRRANARRMHARGCGTHPRLDPDCLRA